MFFNGFKGEKLTSEEINKLKKYGRQARANILKMTTLAKSGHPGGSMSSIDIYLVLYLYSKLDPKDSLYDGRDRIIVSHGHTSPAVYSALSIAGFFDEQEMVIGFRKAGSIFEGHIEKCVPGIEWSTGNLGQGLSAGCGFALAARIKNIDFHTFVAMSDGEQTKGQVGEARRFARKFNLSNLTVIIDYNELQISGSIHEVMPQNIKRNYEADGWKVIEIDGHNYDEIYSALREARNSTEIIAIIAHTTMGKGVSFMENNPDYHGKALTLQQCEDALKELGVENDIEKYIHIPPSFPKILFKGEYSNETKNKILINERKVYPANAKIDNRTAFGNALKEIAEQNPEVPIAVFDCDLSVSVKTDGFSKICGKTFYQAGVQEHSTATIAGALSTQDVLTFFADFGVFGIDETYNQHRLNDINRTNLKLICTHCGLDVGEDGKTHQCIDYIGLLRNLFSFKLIIPADANQTDSVIKYISLNKGNYVVVMGRSVSPIIQSENGTCFFSDNYEFEYGKVDVVREGNKALLLTMGTMLWRAVNVWKKLMEEGISIKILNVSCPLSLCNHIEKNNNTCISEVLDIIKSIKSNGLVITYEDHNINSGLGSIVGDLIGSNGLKCKLIKMGVKRYGLSGTPSDLLKIEKLDEDSLYETIKANI